MKRILKDLLFIVLVLEIGGCCCINRIMFHPVKGEYDVRLTGYVDIGTNGVRIAALVLGPERGAKAILRCHGNAEDMCQSVWLLERLASKGYTVACVDYPGYGLSDGSPNEKGCYRNVHRLYDWLVETRGFQPADIIVDGFSIGSGPAVELAATRPVGGLILECAFLSAPRVVTHVRLLPIDPFPNLKNIKKVTCPLLQFHGTADGVVPYAHGEKLFALANEPKRFISVRGGNHNDFPMVLGPEAYLREIRSFADACGQVAEE